MGFPQDRPCWGVCILEFAAAGMDGCVSDVQWPDAYVATSTVMAAQ